MHGCESWTVKKPEHWKIDAFELWCWRRLLRVPWTSRRSNQSILKEVNPEYSLKGLMLKLKLQYFGHLMQRADSLEKTLMLGKIESRRRGWQRMRWLDDITDSMDLRLSKLREVVKDRKAWRAAVHSVPKSRTRFSNWTTTTSDSVILLDSGLIRVSCFFLELALFVKLSRHFSIRYKYSSWLRIINILLIFIFLIPTVLFLTFVILDIEDQIGEDCIFNSILLNEWKGTFCLLWSWKFKSNL